MRLAPRTFIALLLFGPDTTMLGVAQREWLLHGLAARPGYPRFLDRSLHSRSLASAGLVSNFGEMTIDGTSLQVRIFDASDTLRAALRLRTDGSVRPQPEASARRRRQASPMRATKASALTATPVSSAVAAS